MKNSTNLTDNIEVLNGMNINIYKLIDDLENIGNEKVKEEFIKNYSKIKEQIKIVDSILFNNDANTNNDDNDNNNYESNNINDLLSILESNEDKIFNSSSNLNICELKSLIQICNMLEKKINDETMNIIEIK